MNLWMLTEGEYSDYHVIGVFSTHENALAAQRSTGGDIDEIPIDPHIEQYRQGLKLYYVTMTLDTSVYQYAFKTYSTCEHPIESAEINIGACTNPVPAIKGTVWAKDEQHALKIMNEKRARFVATGILD